MTPPRNYDHYFYNDYYFYYHYFYNNCYYCYYPYKGALRHL